MTAVDHRPFPALAPALDALTGRITAAVTAALGDVKDLGAALLAGQAGQLRPSVFLACAGEAADAEAAGALGEMLELLHLASVLHETGAVADPGDPVWNPGAAILLGDLFLSRAMRLLADHGDPETVRAVARITGDLCEGQILELELRKAPPADPAARAAALREALSKRRGTFLEEAARLGARLAGAAPDEAEGHARAAREMALGVGLLREVTDHGAADADRADLLSAAAARVEAAGAATPAGSPFVPWLAAARAEIEAAAR